MRWLLCLTLALALGSDPAAQSFPGPGEGVFTWERLGDYPLSTRAIAFAPSGTIHTGGGLGPTLEGHHILTGPLPGVWQIVDDNDIGYTRIYSLLALGEGPAGDTLVAGDFGQLLFSSDGGAHWTTTSPPQYPGPEHDDAIFELPAGHPHAGRLLGSPRHYSDDRGQTWTAGDDSAFPNDAIQAYAFAALPSGRVLAAGEWGIAASDDAGETWHPQLFATYGREHGGVKAFATPGSVQAGGSGGDGAISVGYQTDLPGVRVYRTADGGETWTDAGELPQLADGVGLGSVAGVIPLTPQPGGLGRALVVLGRGFVYATADGGATWRIVGRLPVPYPQVSAAVAVLGPDGHLWVGLQRSGPEKEWLYRSAEPAEQGVAVSGESGAPPGALGLRVSPNPAAGAVRVDVEAGAPMSTLSVVVLDALGRRVAVLHEGPAAGALALRAETAGLAPGIYAVVARGAGGVATERFTVAR